MKKSNEEYHELLKEWLIYGMDLAFNRLVDEKRKNNEIFVFGEDGKVVHKNAHEVPYRELKKPEQPL
jgi:hypothetical protein